MKLLFIEGLKLKLTNLTTGRVDEILIDKNGNLKIEIENPADFRF